MMVSCLLVLLLGIYICNSEHPSEHVVDVIGLSHVPISNTVVLDYVCVDCVWTVCHCVSLCV